MRNTTARRVAFTGLLFALAIALSFLESTLTSLLPPGVKLGLANIVVMYALLFLSRKQALLLVLLKSGFALLTRGAMAGVLSLSGGLFSLGIMLLLLLPKNKASLLALSMGGAIMHNVGQFLVVLVLFGRTALGYAPILLVSGVVMGALTAFSLRVLLPALAKTGLSAASSFSPATIFLDENTEKTHEIDKHPLLIGNIPTILWGAPSDKIYIYIHGKMGNKNEAENFAKIADAKGFQTICFDLPQHGERSDESYQNNIWNAIHDLNCIAEYTKLKWKELNIYACSIGAFYALMAYANLPIKNCLFHAPVVDMKKLIETMMTWANISEEQLQEKGEIETSFGETLDWNYYTFVKNNPVTHWSATTHILYGMKDNITDFDTIKVFCKQFDCKLSTWTHMEHHLHTKEDLAILKDWQTENIDYSASRQ